jgi:hypothetical protein
MTLLVAIVPLFMAGGILWLVSSQIAPLGRQIHLTQAIGAVVIMGLCGWAASRWLAPAMGGLQYLVLLVVWAAVVMLMLRLSFSRALVAVLIFTLVLLGGRYGMDRIAHLHNQAEPEAASEDG